MRKQFVFVAAFAAVGVGFAETFTWTGAEDAYWTNAANWTVGGAVATRCPGVLWTGDDKPSQTNDYARQDADADVATFSGAFARSTIDLGGLFSVKNVKVTGADTPSVVFGAAEGQPLPIGYKGSLTVDASVTVAPRLPYGLIMGKGNYDTTTGTKFTLTYNCADPLHIETCCTDTADVRNNPGWYCSVPYFKGSGDIVFDCPVKTVSLVDPHFDTTGTITFNDNLTSVRNLRVYNPKKIVVAPGKYIQMSRNIGSSVRVCGSKSDVVFTGGGRFRFSSCKEKMNGTTEVAKYNCNWYIDVGNQITFDGCFLESIVQNSGNDDCGLMANYAEAATARGTVNLVTTNTITGPVKIYSPITIRTVAIRGDGTDTPLGTGAEIIMARKGTLAYSGEGETTTRLIAVTNAGTCAGTLMQDGPGPWTVASPIVARAGDATLILKNGTDAPAILATALADTDDGGTVRTLSLEKSGPGNWTLAGENTYSGSTVVDGGILTLAADASVGRTSGITLKNGGEFVVEGDAAVALPPVTTDGGINVLRVAGRAPVTVAGVARTAGTLDIRTDYAAAEVTVTSLAGETAPDWLYMNGFRAQVDAGGKVSVDPAYGTVIAAAGDQVPHAVDKPVSIVFKGESDELDTLAQEETQVLSLTQFAPVAATVRLNDGETLSAERVAVSASAAALDVGTEPGVGTLTSVGVLQFENDSTEPLTVRADLKPGADARVEKGTGPVVLAGGAKSPLALKVTDGTVVVTGENPVTFDHVWVGTNSTAVSPKIVFDGAKDVHLGKNTCRFGLYWSPTKKDNHGGMGTVVITNSLIRNDTIGLDAFGDDAPGPDYTTFSAYGFQVGDRCYGELYIQEGAVFTNRLMLGNAFDIQSFGCGTAYQDGGVMAVLSHTVGTHNGSFIGNRNSHGYYELNRGKLHWYGLGGAGGYTSGIMIQHGGEFLATNAISPAKQTMASFIAGFANSGRGQIVFLGGKATFANSALKACGASTYSDGGGEIIFDENADVDTGTYPVYAGTNDGPTNGVKIVNMHDAAFTLAGGTLRAAGFSQAGDPVKRRNRAVVNFNGGTLKLSRDNQDVFKYSTYAMSTVTVFAAGAVIDTDGHVGNKSTVPLQGPAAGGSVTGFASGAFPKTFKTCPSVRITGDSFGASAYPIWNRETKQVTGVRLVSPGTGYASAKLRFYIESEVSGSAVDCTVGTVPNTGSFTKRGAGDFTFLAENTYGGKTILEGGTLVLGVPNALPATTVIVPRGGVLEATADNFPAVLKVDVSELDPEARAVRFAKVTEGELAAPPTVTIVGGEPGEDWHVSSAGGVFKVGVRKGTLLIVK